MRKTLCQVQDLTVVAEGAAAHILLDHVSLTIPNGGVTALIGESGAGKTLLARAIIGLLPAGTRLASGEITMAEPAARRGRTVFYAPQNAAAALNPALRIRRQLCEGGADPERVQWLLEKLGLPDPQRLMGSYPFELSGGENQRCLMALALTMPCDLLLLDEPTAEIDLLQRRLLAAQLRERIDQAKTTLFLISHDLPFAFALAEEVIVMRHAAIVEKGSRERILHAPAHAYTAEIVRNFKQLS